MAVTKDYEACVGRIYNLLTGAVRERGQASLVVPGGKSPLPLFQALQERNMPWESILVTLSDDRWVPDGHPDSNGRQVLEKLFPHGSKPNFIPLVGKEATPRKGLVSAQDRLSIIRRPFDVVVLGMGGDGHFASLFPGMKMLRDALEPAGGLMLVAADEGETPAHARISLTLSALLNSRSVFLLAFGAEKKAVIKRAGAEKGEMALPVAALVKHGGERLCVVEY